MARVLFASLFAVIALSPLPFGSARSWSWSLLALVAGVLLLLWALAARRSGGTLRLPPAHLYLPALLLYAGALAWFLVQAAPWTPVAWHHPFWADIGAALAAVSSGAGVGDGPVVRGAISLDPVATVTGVMRLASYAALFWVALAVGRDAARARALIWCLVGTVGVYSLYGLAAFWSGNDTILWYEKWAYADSLSATFVNRNSFAAWAGLGCVAAVGLFWEEVERAMSAGHRLLHAIEALRGRAFLLVVMLLVTGTALLFTHSRGGLVVTIAGLAALVLGLAINRRGRFVAVAGFGAVVLIAGGALFFASGQGTASRVQESDTTGSGRQHLWQVTIEAIAERPLLGTGLGTYAGVFHLIRDENFEQQAIGRHAHAATQAHNSYLELALEGGLPAAAALHAALAWLLVVVAGGMLTRRRDGLVPVVAFAGTVLLAAHSTIDFSLQIPAIAATWAILLGVGCAQSQSSRLDGEGGRANGRASRRDRTRS
ncbi:MAG: O-antigen ligase family protein [Alphaproteobacteria bacterium]